MKNKYLFLGICSFVSLGVGVNNASALTVDGSGKVTDWNVTPFTSSVPADVTFVDGNDLSPINYPHGVGYVPSPGGATGEKFDLEGLYAKRDGNTVKVLLVASSLMQSTANGYTFNLGDLLIDVDDNGTVDMGVVTQNDNAGLVAGGLYEVTGTRGLQHKPGSYYQYSSVTDVIGAWAITAGNLVDQDEILTACHSYAGEANTYLYEYSFDLEEEMKYHDLNMQLAWGCGNDMIELTLEALERPVIEGDPDPSPTPEPATAALGLMGLAGLAAAARRRRTNA